MNRLIPYYRARYYSPTIGRFISRDPIGTAGGINLYAYVRDNPANKVDPMGLMAARPKCTDDGGEQYADGKGWTPRGAGYQLEGSVGAGAFSTEYTQAKGLWTAQITVNCTACCTNKTATGTRNYDSDAITLNPPIFTNNPANLPMGPSTSLWEAFIDWLWDKTSDLPATTSNKDDATSVLNQVSSTKPSSASSGSWANGTPCT